MSDTATASSRGVFPLIGADGEEVEAFAFRGGGFDTVMYLGVAQAWLLIHREKPPHVLSGVSAGAVGAAAMAEILGQREDDRAARLRTFVQAYSQAPGELLRSLLPDPHEIEAQHPLQSLVQPTYVEDERRDRNEAVGSRSGLIRLANDILAVGLPISAATRFVRIGLGLRALPALRGSVRFRQTVALVLSLWGLVLLYAHHLIGPLLGLVRGVVMPRGPASASGRTAARLLSVWRRPLRKILARLLWVMAYIVFAGLWLLAPAVVAALPFVAPLTFIIAIAVVLLAGLTAWHWHVTSRLWTVCTRRLLKYYDLREELAGSYDLKQILVRLFDPDYYGESSLELQKVLDRARTPNQASSASKAPRPLWSLSREDHRDGQDLGLRRLHVAPAAADLAKRTLTAIPDADVKDHALRPSEVSIVDALMASLAVSPFLKPVSLQVDGGEHIYVDGTNIANEPITALMDYLRTRVNPSAGQIVVYAVGPFPSAAGTGAETVPHTRLTDVVARVLELQRQQVATLERQLTECYTKLLDPHRATTGGANKTYLNVVIKPIDAASPLQVNKRLAAASTERERQDIVHEAVAEGCRATLQAFLTERGQRTALRCAGWAANLVPLPSHVESIGPGLPEICACCPARASRMAGADAATDLAARTPEDASAKAGAAAEERVDPGVASAPVADGSPWSVLLMSGGVFRGVFQIGVMIGASEAGLSPKLFVGSSVGSIVAAMATRFFATPRTSPVGTCRSRDETSALLAATFLQLDRLILTDRFADFVRRLTLRAGETRVSLRDLDRLFRRYDLGGTAYFGRTARRVVAGIERLLYVAPFELLDLVRIVRQQPWGSASRKVLDALQHYLERSGVGLEVLGAERLRWLIEKHVLSPDHTGSEITFEDFGRQVNFRYLLVTTTNLQSGKLEVLGMLPKGDQNPPRRTRLLDALLASSAFPGVFRPRQGFEVCPDLPDLHQFTDGGVMDNLPLYAVAQFLDRAEDAGLAKRRPTTLDGLPVPHLLLTASLEPEIPELDDLAEVRKIAGAWPAVRKRVVSISYNQKVDAFAGAQDDFRRLYTADNAWTPVDLHVVTVKAHWLCDTYGFHPMLGFRSLRQAQSIAHGCAMTLATLARLSGPTGQGDPREPGEREAQTRWAAAWGLTDDFDREQANLWGSPIPLLTPTAKRADGDCWFRTPTHRCPFSRNRLGKLVAAGRLPREVAADAEKIYAECGKLTTHRSPDDGPAGIRVSPRGTDV
ncbi:MAG TPA: patatin-like phospholipase family protein [Vicinamibacterales bacterium]|jgi:predicted acylesterase/phospholipase RssA